MFSIKEAISFGWHKVKDNLWKVVGIMVVSLIPSVVSQIFGAIMEHTESTILTILLALCWIAVYVVSFIVGIALMKLMLRIHDGEMPSPKELFSTYGVFWKYIGVNIIYGLIVIGGFILLIVPGVIWCIKYSFAPILVIDKKMRPMEAIRESGRLTAGSKGKVFLFGIVSMLVVMLGYIALFVGSLVSIPVSMLAWVHVYRSLESEKGLLNNENLTTNTASV